MRRKYLGLAIAAAATLGPAVARSEDGAAAPVTPPSTSQTSSNEAATANPADQRIAAAIVSRLKANRDAGELKDFTLDMKVNDGVVMFRGAVTGPRQRDLVLAAADGISGVARVVDEVRVTATPQAASPATSPADSGFDLASALSETADQLAAETGISTAALSGAEPMFAPEQLDGGGMVAQTAGYDSLSDTEITQGVIGRLKQAQSSGELRGFGVDVDCVGGVVTLDGRVSSAAQRSQLVSMVGAVPGVTQVRPKIMVLDSVVQPAPQQAPQALSPANGNLRAIPASARTAQPITQNASMRGGYQAQPASTMMGGPVMGAPVVAGPVSTGAYGGPVPMAPHSAVGAPRYDNPYLPNYAWPGYASHPNYAAVTYPQQYSPTAWPYIGPFYPYPQVPLGWRKVSLEWDDGWWMLDFTDRDY